MCRREITKGKVKRGKVIRMDGGKSKIIEGVAQQKGCERKEKVREVFGLFNDTKF